MAGETPITVIGNLTADPELRAFNRADGQQGIVLNGTVASTPRRYNSQTQAWEDGDTAFFPFKIFGTDAQHLAASATKGTRLIVTGSLTQESWDEKDQATQLPTGKKNSRLVINADEIGISTKFGTAAFQRVQAAPVAAAVAPVAAPAVAPVAAAPVAVAPVAAAPVAAAPAVAAPPMAAPVAAAPVAPNGQAVQF